MTKEKVSARAMRLAARLLPLAVVLAAITIFVGGWLAGVRRLAMPFEGLPVTAPRTAIAFALAGLALLLHPLRGRRLLCDALALITAGIAGLDGTDFGWAGVSWPSNTMALPTEIAFYAAAACILSVDGPGRRSRRVFFVIALPGLAWSLGAGTAFAAGSREVFGSPLYAGMAPHTVYGFVLLFTAAIAARMVHQATPLVASP